ncbi:hypothetical protein [Bosea sp. (in: a-proteobacteria)]|uniref:hypothetical protein n=1 Tax=Bosea sp. (in: a-proteobacteria) TaxID=1871050 RepID=UPI00263A1B00|nr:hypothetical protein [Bosea sp. (in: a-proteobacteria)]MCO5090878.1 hypothetical protein [Bosea sp. (in: a-proteobacteria)]
MTIYAPNPAACVSRLRDALGPVADKLRRKGATVEFLDQGGPITHTIVMMVTMRFPLPEAVAATMRLKEFAERSGGVVYGTLLTTEQTDVPEGEYRVALSHTVMKRRAA